MSAPGRSYENPPSPPTNSTCPIPRNQLIPGSFIQMAGMVTGSMIEADYSLRQYEAHVRMQKRLKRDKAMWEEFDRKYGKDDEDD